VIFRDPRKAGYIADEDHELLIMKLRGYDIVAHALYSSRQSKSVMFKKLATCVRFWARPKTCFDLKPVG